MAQWAVQRQRVMGLRPLFDYLQQRGIRQTWLAARLGITPQRLSQIKSGILPTPEGFVEIACAELGISPKLLSKPTLPVAPQPRRKSKIVA